MEKSSDSAETMPRPPTEKPPASDASHVASSTPVNGVGNHDSSDSDREKNDDGLKPSESPSPAPAPASSMPVAPNGGVLAWLQVAGSFCIFLNTWGVVNMYGVFQTYYSVSLEGSSSSAISWIGSVQVFLLSLIGTLVGPIYDGGNVRSLLVVGLITSVLGVFMTSLCTQYWQLFLAQGILTGFGFGCLFLPGVAIVSQYFTTKKAFATGIASLGSSIGGVVYPILWTQLQPKIGFGWATRVIGFIMFGTLLLPLVALRPLQYPKTRRSLFDVSSLRDVPYVLFGLGTFFGYMGIYIVFFYIELYAMSRANVSAYMGFYLLALINAGSSLGRVLPNFAADYVGTLNMQTSFAFFAAILSLVLLAIRNTQGIIAFCVLYGFFTGTFVSLPAPTVASLTPNLALLGGRMSMAFMAAGLGSLIGSPIAGAILATNGGENWVGLQIWAAVLLVLSTAAMVGARTAKVGFKIYAKA